ncbi:MAG: hypothetical protein A3E84_05350 [Gammaproteobacteria bacterium RIFCSPHIGHO2_12_FULL_42_13]|nr:MAG: hypothetical protein A3E84_05350 [Gammaproteobacteria bacterium RIFCSPHIGHO2_12_FULL_42_13]
MMKPQLITINNTQAGQRIDNFLVTLMKGVPRSRIYRALRKGEVRVNKGRVQPTYRLQAEDILRLPPLRTSATVMPTPSKNLRECLKKAIIFENKDYLVINKPVGLAVHGGTEVGCGVIEAFKVMRPDSPQLSLGHRLDRDTSGCLLLAKHRKALLEFHALLKKHVVEKRYILLVKGFWKGGKQRVALPLLKNKQLGGERIVISGETGKPAETIFEPVQVGKKTSLLRATLITGRTHQIRVHAAELGFPIVGDPKYGDREFNKEVKANRLFLHAETLSFGEYIFSAPVDFG